MREFLEKVAPGVTAEVADLCGDWHSYPGRGDSYTHLKLPEITLHCDTQPSCGGFRLFDSQGTHEIRAKVSELKFLKYICKNCSKSVKLFSLKINAAENTRTGKAYKFGELPNFGPPNSPRLITLIRDQRDLFLKGRRAENQGMGIAAFAYYRRVIDDQRVRIFDEIIKVCQRLSADESIIQELTAAKNESQFSKAIESVKHGIPEALFISGQNPLTLLHSALSEGLHGKSDEECLENATNIRIVMAEFAERMGQVLKDEAELSAAVSRLLNKKSASAKPTLSETNPSSEPANSESTKLDPPA
ncbi:MAG: hypothetical protein ABSE51_00265 [Terracidiphilus sp.]|jgi:hypothetical protein